MPNRAVFLDRDGTMAIDVHYCSCPEDFHLFPGTAEAIRLLREHGFKVIVITNQSGIGRGYFTAATLERIHAKMKMELDEEGATLDSIYYCPHHPDDNCDCRKPRSALVLRAARDFDIDLSRSFVVGDLQVDVDLGKNTGCRTVLVGTPQGSGAKPDACVTDILEAARAILKMDKGT